jgi:hypothetical protein
VLVDALSAREGGGVTYVTKLLPELNRRPGLVVTVLLSSSYQKKLIDHLGSQVEVIDTRLPPSPFRRILYLQKDLPKLVKEHRFDVLFCVSEVGSLRASCPLVLLVRNGSLFAPWDALPGLSRRTIRALRRSAWRPLVRLSLRRADGLIFVSHALKTVVDRTVRTQARLSQVTYHGVDVAFSRRPDAPPSP